MPAATTSTNVREPLLSINEFNVPDELENEEMWVKLMCGLIFLEKGTYSDEPNAGVEIVRYEYDDLIQGKIDIEEEIFDQCRTYLSDIPLVNVTVKPHYWEARGEYVVRILFYFAQDDQIYSRAVDLFKEDKILKYLIAKFDSK